MRTEDSEFMNFILRISKQKQIANERECRLITKHIELFSLAMMSASNDKDSKNFFLNTANHIISTYPDAIDCEPFIHSTMAIFTGIKTNTELFAYLLILYLTNDEKYDEYMRAKVHHEEHHDIIISAKRIQKCLEIIYRICKGKVNDGLYLDILQNVCIFNGSLEPHSLINDAFLAIDEELEHLKKYDFFIMLGRKINNIYGFIVHELLDCGDELEEYVEHLSRFLNVTGLYNYVEALKYYDISQEEDTWSHRQFQEFKNHHSS